MVVVPLKLTSAQKKELIDLEADIRALDVEIKRAARAGLDVTELKASFDKATTLRTGILREYG